MCEDVENLARIAALETEVAQLRHAITAHATVDQAMGVVIACSGATPETAWEILRDVSQHTNIRLREIAEHIRQWPHCERLPEEVRHALDAAVRARCVSAPAAGV
ncbi:ANTAR domain-containing protein [Streptomyces broussonetiae]|uniref:ANTAR domain-containing protein n=1 Tax=Streptomyces broussonetiae TaxID=2686304 RepID=A0A6I6NCJ7_9ACTN|nr:ANTAR domain-containing protein [Streptomyces broussonetiae]QHA09142.1 ANTAR domain-containing protein [Streptomyces broussonetiae]